VTDDGSLRPSSVMAVGTAVSRVTGLVRTWVLVAAIGTSVFSDTYTVANTVPNIVYILLIGGALNAVFIPQLVRHMSDDPDDGDGFAHRLLTATMTVLLVVTVLAVLLAPLIVRLYATRLWTAQDFAVSIAFARFCLPQIFFYGLYTLLSQVLNARGRFAAPMFAPIINNLVVIAVALAFLFAVGPNPSTATITDGEVAWLGLGTTLGIVVQALVLIPVLRASGFRLRWRFDWRGAGLGKSWTLARWTIFLVLANQVGLLVVSRLATAANASAGGGTAGLTTYTTAYLFFGLPQSIITVSVVTAIMPTMSRLAHADDLAGVRREVTGAVRLTGSLVTPAGALLAVLGPAIGVLLFGYAASGTDGGFLLGLTLAGFMVGLPFYSAYYVVMRGFYALEDTRIPALNAMVVNAVAIATGITAYLLLPDRYVVPGLAVAFSVGYVVGVLLLWRQLRVRLLGLDTVGVMRAYRPIVAASLLAAGAGFATSVTVRWLGATWPTTARALAQVTVGGLVGLGIYLWLARRWRIDDVQVLLRGLRRRIRPAGA
jgi:putative peptidoglycan lipid II flippase